MKININWRGKIKKTMYEFAKYKNYNIDIKQFRKMRGYSRYTGYTLFWYDKPKLFVKDISFIIFKKLDEKPTINDIKKEIEHNIKLLNL